MIEPVPEHVLYCYGEFQPSFAEFPNVEFHNGLPDITSFDGRKNVLLILDDLMNEANQNVCEIFTKLSHHRNVSVIFVTQNLFHKNPCIRTMSLNSHYIVLFKNVRDASQIATLGRQMYPGKSKFVVEAYRDATEEPFSYLLIDLRPDTDENYRLRAKIFPDDDRQYVYVPRV